MDTVIRDRIPAGFSIRKRPHRFSDSFDFGRLCCGRHVNVGKAALSLGTLGGGNHFIEIDKDRAGNLYAAVHSGRRHLGKEVTEYYLDVGQKVLKSRGIQIPYELTFLDGMLMDDYLHDLQVVQEFAVLSGKPYWMNWQRV